MMRKFFIILILILPVSTDYVFSQTEALLSSSDLVYNNNVYQDNIFTPLLYRNGGEITYPVIKLGSDEALYLGFDEFSDETSQYNFTIVHCNSDWTPSSLSPLDYIDGFVENPVSKYEFSFNTLVPYIHYSVVFPNESMKPKISGNYLVIVYTPDYSLVLSRRFMVYEPLCEVTANVKKSSVIDKMKSHQEIDFTIKTSTTVNDPYQEIKPVIIQNGFWQTAITGLKPLFVKDNELIYDYFDENCFGGGGEFHYIDMKSMRYQSDRISAITFEKPYYHVLVVPDEQRRFKVYLNWQDINGRYLIKNSDAEKSNTESDYAVTHFRLKMPAPVKNGNLYVSGWFTDWHLNDKYKMEYNNEEKEYRASIIMKQGYYNYQYVFVDDSTHTPDVSFIEGNHYETENEYMILVYNRSFGSRYDKLAAFTVINSKNIIYNNF